MRRTILARGRRLRFGIEMGGLVRERWRFIGNEFRNRSRVAAYRVREPGVAVFIRHHADPNGTPSIDTWILKEIFGDRAYEVPEAVDLPAAPRILDLGANIGLFAAFILCRYPAARLVAFEPDPANVALLTKTLRRNGLEDRTEVHAACAMDRDGPVAFATGGHQFSRIASAGDPEALEVAGIDVLPRIRQADLVKIDIEGGEWALLADARFGGAHALVLEYHPMMCPDGDPELAVRRLLTDRGYRVLLHEAPVLWAVPAEKSVDPSAR